MNKTRETPLFFDRNLLFLIAIFVVIFHTITNGQYGFHRDELDMLMNARQLDWGYVAYPPFTPLMARIGLELFGNSLIGTRFPAALAQGIAVLLIGWMARDMGGKRKAQVLAMLTAAIAPVALTAGTLIQYMSFDYLWWVVVAFFTVRLIATDDPRWWLGIGAGIGMGMMTKFTIAFFVIGLIMAVLLSPLRRHLTSKWLWAGAALALVIFLPNLIWQVRHDFISFEFPSSIHARDIEWGRTDGYLPEQLYVTANPLTLPLWIAGLYFLLISPAGRRFRPLVWMFLTTFTLLLVTRGRSYYLGPAYALLLVAGSVWFESWVAQRNEKTRRLMNGLATGLVILGTLVGVVLSKPVVPIGSALWEITSEVNDNFGEMVGWPELTQQIANVYAAIPAAEKPRTAILAGNYGEAGAIELYGPAYGLPRIISGANSLWARGYGDPPPETLILVGFQSADANQLFKSCQFAGQVSNSYGVKNEESTWYSGLYVCREPRHPWAEMWPEKPWFE